MQRRACLTLLCSPYALRRSRTLRLLLVHLGPLRALYAAIALKPARAARRLATAKLPCLLPQARSVHIAAHWGQAPLPLLLVLVRCSAAAVASKRLLLRRLRRRLLLRRHRVILVRAP